MRFIAGAAALALLAGGLGATVTAEAATASPQHAASAIRWHKCPRSYPDLRSIKAQCATLKVPVDYSDPKAGTSTIEISRIKHTSSAKHYQGVILTNPGGPGGEGIDLNYYLVGQLQAEAAAAKGKAKADDEAAVKDYDWIGFDPRGVDLSSPISCDPDYFVGPRESYDPTTSAILSYWLKNSKTYADDCLTKGAAQNKLLNNDTTIDSARDMDSIRAALGVKQITYYGFSYGTYLGQVYATLFPTHVRRLILDSNVDPRNVWYQANLNQDVTFNRNIGIWFAWLAKYNDVYDLGSTEAQVQSTWYADDAALATDPIKVGTDTIGPDEFNDIFLEASYYEQTWLQLGQAFADWNNTHSTAAAQEIDTLYQDVDTPGSDNSFAGYVGVECSDAHWPPLNQELRANTKLNAKYPFETWGNAWFNAPCMYWPYKVSKPLKISGKRIRNALLIDETLDAATPFEGSVYVRKLFPHSVLLAEPGGTTHADSLSGDLCVDNTIARYLATGYLPPRKAHAEWDITCKPLPVPVPTSSSSVSRSALNSAKRAMALGGLIG
jgi:pimeloyl-ACP methyl ester carboxylesterase